MTRLETAMGRTNASPQQSLKKRLGQYFTGEKLSRLLAALANAQNASSIIDPMGGSGDMLRACFNLGALPESMAMIDIDPQVVKVGKHKIESAQPPNVQFLTGSAFQTQTIAKLSVKSWDLVITNPPYVRYQSMANNGDYEFRLPCGNEIRADLIQAIELLAGSDQERELLSSLATRYSGLSDLAVPCWILCAALVRPGGTMAMVLPESWLSRDYAWVVNYLLLRMFKIEHIVEDTNISWFPDIQVKTNLLVARKTGIRSSAFEVTSERFRYTKLFSAAASQSSLVSHINPRAKNPELAISKRLAQLSNSEEYWESTGIQSFSIPTSFHANRIKPRYEKSTRKQEPLETPTTLQNECDPWLPLELELLHSQSKSTPTLTTLSQLGVRVGQGLRTGANSFFYVDCKETRSKSELVVTSETFGNNKFWIPRHLLSPVLRSQSELPEGYRIDSTDVAGRVLLLNKCFPEEALKSPSGCNDEQLDVLPDDLAAYINLVSVTNIGSSDEEKYVPNLSAVAPNARRKYMGGLRGYWYMLPELTDRHVPDLAMPRVLNLHAKAYIIPGKNLVVDANFSTFWLDTNSPLCTYSLFAILNSSWSKCYLESVASVMGGRALKVEAAHLREMAIPSLGTVAIGKLRKLGGSLSRVKRPESTNKIRNSIDRVLSGYIKNEMLSALANSLLNDRKSRDVRSV